MRKLLAFVVVSLTVVSTSHAQELPYANENVKNEFQGFLWYTYYDIVNEREYGFQIAQSSPTADSIYAEFRGFQHHLSDEDYIKIYVQMSDSGRTATYNLKYEYPNPEYTGAYGDLEYLEVDAKLVVKLRQIDPQTAEESYSVGQFVDIYWSSYDPTTRSYENEFHFGEFGVNWDEWKQHLKDIDAWPEEAGE